jgi:tRNA(Arg) A34 adenosine deaminase TadA
VARGHNQMFHSGPGPLSATYMAHAEMNALAQLPARRGPDYSIYSTFEPCYMCMSTILIYRVERVFFATPDPVWTGMHEWLGTAPWASRKETRHELLPARRRRQPTHSSSCGTTSPTDRRDAAELSLGPDRTREPG